MSKLTKRKTIVEVEKRLYQIHLLLLELKEKL